MKVELSKFVYASGIRSIDREIHFQLAYHSNRLYMRTAQDNGAIIGLIKVLRCFGLIEVEYT